MPGETEGQTWRSSPCSAPDIRLCRTTTAMSHNLSDNRTVYSFGQRRECRGQFYRKLRRCDTAARWSAWLEWHASALNDHPSRVTHRRSRFCSIQASAVGKTTCYLWEEQVKHCSIHKYALRSC